MSFSPVSFVSKLLAPFTAVVACAVLTAACGSAPEPGVGETSEALAPICPTYGCGGAKLAPTCATWSLPPDFGYPGLWTMTGRAPDMVCTPDTAFAEQMAANNCEPAFAYEAIANVSPAYAVAFCPSVVAPAWAVTPDACTGPAPEGWTLVTWHQLQDPCGQPSGGCHTVGCKYF